MWLNTYLLWTAVARRPAYGAGGSVGNLLSTRKNPDSGASSRETGSVSCSGQN
jgi:hypothetical protein